MVSLAYPPDGAEALISSTGAGPDVGVGAAVDAGASVALGAGVGVEAGVATGASVGGGAGARQALSKLVATTRTARNCCRRIGYLAYQNLS